MKRILEIQDLQRYSSKLSSNGKWILLSKMQSNLPKISATHCVQSCLLQTKLILSYKLAISQASNT
jgi:hypothetical protein